MSAITVVPLIKAVPPHLEFVAASLREILASGRVINFGKHVTQFEQGAADYLGAKVATTSSGTMSLIFALQALRAFLFFAEKRDPEHICYNVSHQNLRVADQLQ